MADPRVPVLPQKTPIPFPAAPSRNNRRRHGRVRCNGLSCDLGDVLDVSASGMQVAVGRKPVPVGTELSFAIQGPDEPVAVRAVVLRCEKIGRGHELGLEFQNLSREAARGLATIARIAATKTETLRG